MQSVPVQGDLAPVDPDPIRADLALDLARLDPGLARPDLDLGLARLDLDLAPLDPGLARLDLDLAPLDPGLARLDLGLARLDPDPARLDPDPDPDLVRLDLDLADPDLVRLDLDLADPDLVRLDLDLADLDLADLVDLADPVGLDPGQLMTTTAAWVPSEALEELTREPGLDLAVMTAPTAAQTVARVAPADREVDPGDRVVLLTEEVRAVEDPEVVPAVEDPEVDRAVAQEVREVPADLQSCFWTNQVGLGKLT